MQIDGKNVGKRIAYPYDNIPHQIREDATDFEPEEVPEDVETAIWRLASMPAFRKVWDNGVDAVYEKVYFRLITPGLSGTPRRPGF